MTVRRFHLERAEQIVPIRNDFAQDRIKIGCPVAGDQGSRIGRRRCLAEEENDIPPRRPARARPGFAERSRDRGRADPL